MSKDLYTVAFSALSRIDPEAYDREYVQRFPFLLFHAAAEANLSLRAGDGFDEIYAVLENESARHWNNPELYPHLEALKRGDEASRQRCLDALRVHLGLREPFSGVMNGRRYLRLRAPSPVVLEYRDGEFTPCNDVVVDDIGIRPFAICYRPYPQLFDDVVGPEIYCGAHGDEPRSDIRGLVLGAADDLRRFDQNLFENFSRTIGTVALVAREDEPERGARSFSTGIPYLGGIFSVIADNVPSLVENFIHEYYHARFWMWWLLDAPADLPPQSMTIVSPISAATRSVSVMMQALLIYASVSEYLRSVRDRDACEADVRTWVVERLQKIEPGTRELARRLDAALAGRPESRRLVTLIRKYHEAAADYATAP